MLPFATTLMDLENTMLSEISQSEKNKYRKISLTGGIQTEALIAQTVNVQDATEWFTGKWLILYDISFT